LKECIEKQDDGVQNILLIGHNNGLSDFVSYLVGDAIYLPTSGYVELELPIESWSHSTSGIATIRTDFFSEFR
jgi:phosphohistidine phosphatase